MNQPPVCPRSLRIFLACAVVVVPLVLLETPSIQDLVEILREATNRPGRDVVQSRCEFPLVYNKPPKTASSKIREDLSEWGSKVGRSVFRCSPFTRQATFQMRECIPESKDGCAIVATHVKLSRTMSELIRSRVGDFRLLTSTRNSKDRIFSMFLQASRLRASKVRQNSTLLRDFLSKYNPWELYNYHTGEGREGKCPLTLQEIASITDIVNRVDIVIDANLRNISNAILKRSNLFQLTDSIVNRRSTNGVNVKTIDEGLQEMLDSVSCVEDEMHRMFRLRMASLYQKATGIKCLSNTRYPTPTCF